MNITGSMLAEFALRLKQIYLTIQKSTFNIGAYLQNMGQN